MSLDHRLRRPSNYWLPAMPGSDDENRLQPRLRCTIFSLTPFTYRRECTPRVVIVNEKLEALQIRAESLPGSLARVGTSVTTRTNEAVAVAAVLLGARPGEALLTLSSNGGLLTFYFYPRRVPCRKFNRSYRSNPKPLPRS